MFARSRRSNGLWLQPVTGSGPQKQSSDGCHTTPTGRWCLCCFSVYFFFLHLTSLYQHLKVHTFSFLYPLRPSPLHFLYFSIPVGLFILVHCTSPSVSIIGASCVIRIDTGRMTMTVQSVFVYSIAADFNTCRAGRPNRYISFYHRYCRSVYVEDWYNTSSFHISASKRILSSQCLILFKFYFLRHGNSSKDALFSHLDVFIAEFSYGIDLCAKCHLE